MTRIAVLDSDRCRSRDCGRVCYKYCPMVRSRVDAIKFPEDGEKPIIVEELCSGCGICVKKCPFKAIAIVNLPDELEMECSHRYGPNAFKLYRLPIPQPGVVIGLVGKNGTGKTTALRILAGEIKPNLGDHEEPPDWQQIIHYYRGSVLQEYFAKLSKGELKTIHKPQYVDQIPKAVSGKVGELLEHTDERRKLENVSKGLQLNTIWDRTLDVLSGGELQRVAIAAAILRDADVYVFDEPSSYLDVKQRLEAAKAIRTLIRDQKMVVIAEHDLAVLDYLSDRVCVLYGEPGVYGIVSHVHGVRVGINLYLEGYIPDENIKFRKIPIKFHVKPPTATWSVEDVLFRWNSMTKTYENFNLTVKSGEARKGEVLGILGPNGIGKTTFIKLLAGLEKPDQECLPTQESMMVSYKPQYISAEYEGAVQNLLRSIAGGDFESSWYNSEIIQSLNLEKLLDRQVTELSGGELQRVAIAACLSKKAKIYLLDEPSAYLDVEERLAMARTIRRIVENREVTAFVVEHDVAAQDFLSDRIIVFTGKPGIAGQANQPTTLRNGMNNFLKDMEITFRRDPTTKRPRVNKDDSRLDRYQKEIGEYYYISEK